MLEMMQRMMGKEPDPNAQQKQGQKAGDAGGDGIKGDSDSTNPPSSQNESREDTKTERRVPKAAGRAGSSLPSEFQKALDAYHKTPK